MARPALSVLMTLAALAGCTSVKAGNILDTKGAAKQIARNLATTTGLATPDVRCPAGIRVRAGGTFDCTTSLESEPLTIHVSMDDDKGHFTPQPDAAVMVVAKVESGIKAQVDQQTASASTVNCGSHKVLVKMPGDSFECTVITSAVSRTVSVTVKDRQGTFQFDQTGPVTTAGP